MTSLFKIWGKIRFCGQKFDKNSSRKLANLIPICLDFYLFATQFWPSRFLENQDWRHLLWQSHFWFRSENLNWICHFRQKKVCRGACNYCLHHNKVFCAFYFALSKNRWVGSLGSEVLLSSVVLLIKKSTSFHTTKKV